MISVVRTVTRYRKVLLYTTLAEIKSRYVGTALGLLWNIAYPLLFLAMYAVVYSYIYEIRLGKQSTADFVLTIFAGLIPFLNFSECLGTGTSSVISNRNLIKNTLFPIELVPAKAVLSCSTTLLISTGILISALWLKGIFHFSQLAVLPILILQLIFTLGVIYLLAAITVFLKDLSQMIGLIVLALMLVSPIAYTTDMVPPSLQPILWLNPLAYLIHLYRSSLIEGTLPLGTLVVFLCLSIATFALGAFIFTRLKPEFDNYV